jgi:hypothetical protein
MDRRPNQETMKVSREVLTLVRQIAAITGEKHYAVVARLLRREWQRVQSASRSKESTHAS